MPPATNALPSSAFAAAPASGASSAIAPVHPAAGGARVALAAVPSVFRCGELPPGIEPGIPTGFDGLDAEIPGGGWPVGALTEVL